MAVFAQPGSADAQPMPADSDAGKAGGKKRKHAAVSASAAEAASSSRGSGLVRYVFYKSQSAAAAAGEDDVKPGCTLFVVNVPPFYTAEHLMQLFTCFGAVENVNFLQMGPAASLATQLDRVGAVQPSSFYRSAHVVFEEEQSVEMARTTDLSRMPQQCPTEEDDAARRGMRSWIAAYHTAHPDVAALQMQVDRFMEGFDARSAAERAAARTGAQQDADGWTLVRSTQRNNKRALMAREEETERAASRAAKKARQNTVVHFYKHHEREAKKERLLALREKFEQDKLKIAKMKQERKFKPY